jgi:catechol 2,3-dioxygenase-like lactoylglutathione lyase family enzyme
MRGRTTTQWWGVALDAPDPIELARFYSGLLGWPVAGQDENGASIGVPGTTSFLAFQRATTYERPVWPATEGSQQMMLHLDIAVDDLEVAVEDAIALGAAVAEHQPQDDVRVLLDPAGHPFCLYLDVDP